MDPETPQLQIAHGSRILYGMGIVDAFGHVSCRNPERPDRFYMSRNRAPGMVEPGDIGEYNFDAEPLTHTGVRIFLERFIHAEIYRARPDVNAVVHSHCASVVPFTAISEARLRPISHVCGFLDGVGPPFDIAAFEGPSTDLLIRNGQAGRALAAHLGNAKVVLMRSHGFTTVGETIPAAVFRAIYTAVNCQIQTTALQLGTPRYLTPGEALACEETTLGQIARLWELWVTQFGFQNP